MVKRADIANKIRNLGAGYRQLLRDGWFRYLSLKNAAGGAGRSARQLDNDMRDKIMGGGDEKLVQQLAGFDMHTGTGFHLYDGPRCSVKAFGIEACLPTRCSSAAGVELEIK